MAAFVPRTAFPIVDALPRSYFLGHHRAGLEKMKQTISAIDLVIECRDYRAPLSSRNPLFEEALGEKPRLIVYTKQDLGSHGTSADKQREDIIRQWDKPAPVQFHDLSRSSSRSIVKFAREKSLSANRFMGSRMMVVGMPNVGKSTLLNSLRSSSLGKKKKAAATGAQPGVTRKIGTEVKIIEGTDSSENVYLSDTPGVFVPYVSDRETMLKLALCGSVKDTIIAPTTLADYLLYHLNRVDPSLYSSFSTPTNEIFQLLNATATKTGRLQKGGTPDTEATALWLIQRWRQGLLGRMVLDDITEDAFVRREESIKAAGGSLNQARKEAKSAMVQISRNRSRSLEAG